MKIDGVPTDTFYRMIADLCAVQWKVVSEYSRLDKGIDYNAVVLRNKGAMIEFKWILYLDGSIEGSDAGTRRKTQSATKRHSLL